MKKYPVAKHLITEEDKKSVLEALASDYLSLGPKNRELESEICQKIGVKYASTVSSGTTGLHLCLLACGVGPGDEVITSAFSYIASVNCITYVGAKPVFVDVDIDSYQIQPSEIEKKITDKTKAILVPHIFYQLADIEKIKKIADRHRLKIIEDACEVIGAKYKSAPAGSFGDVGVFAFFPNKQVIAGEGGVVVTNDKTIYEIVSSLKNQGKAISGSSWFDFDRIGYNYRMDEMSAALAVSQIRRLEEIMLRRSKLAELYNRHLETVSEKIALPVLGPGMTPSWFVYPVRIKNDHIHRDDLRDKLAQKGVSTREYFPAIHLLPFYSYLGYHPGDLPVTELLSEKCFVLPFYLELTEEDVKTISDIVIEVLKDLG